MFVIFQLQRIDKTGTANVGIRGVSKDGWDLLRSKSIKLLDAFNAPWTLVDLAWTPKTPAGGSAENENDG